MFMYKTRLTANRKKRCHKKIIIILSLSLLFFMVIGYAAFNTNINITAKGNIYNISDKCFETSDNSDGTVTITNYDEKCGSDVIIPETIKGKTVTKIASTSYDVYRSFNHKNLTSVVIPDTITYIGVFAFYGNKITKLDLGQGITKIDNEAFHSNSISELTFPKSLKEIGRGAFLRNYLTSIPNLDNIIYGDGAFTNNCVTGEKAFIYAKNEDGSTDYSVLNSYAGGQSKIDILTIPEGIKELSPYSLRYVSASRIILPNTIEKIDTSALMQSGADVINIPNSIKEIEQNAFTQATQIKTINIEKPKNSVTGSPWGATNATVNWAE